MPLNLADRFARLFDRAISGSERQIATRPFKAFRRKQIAHPSAWINVAIGEKLARIHRDANITTFVRKDYPDSGKWATITDVFDTHTRELNDKT